MAKQHKTFKKRNKEAPVKASAFGNGGFKSGYAEGGEVSAAPGRDMDFLNVGRADPGMQRRLDNWTQAVTERAPESQNIEDRRAGESAFDRYTGIAADKARDIWSNITDPLPPPRYQQGGEVQPRPTHAVHNNANQRMIAHFARRDPQRAKHLLQGLRREHNGLRAMATAALAHSHGLRTVGRHELAHGHDAHAMHLLNMAHANVPDGAEVNFTQHNDHHFNANVKRNGRETNYPLSRHQLLQWAIGPAGGFDHSIVNGAEKNLGTLTRPRMGPVRGYQGGGEVTDDDREWDPATQSYFSAGTPPADPDTQDVRQVLDETHRDHGLIEREAGRLQRAGVPAFDPSAPTPDLSDIRPGGAFERGIEERHRQYVAEPAQRYLQHLLHPTTATSAGPDELQRARDEASAPRDVTYGPEALVRPRGAEEAPTTTGRTAEPERDYYSTPLLSPKQALERGPVQGPSQQIYQGEVETDPTGNRYRIRGEIPSVIPPLDPGATPAEGSPARIAHPMEGMDPSVKARLLADPEVGPVLRHQMETAPRVGESVGPAPLGPTIEDVRSGRYTPPRSGYATEGALPSEIPAGYQTQPGTMERFKEMWQRGRVLDPRQPAAERGTPVEEGDFVKQLQTQARAKNDPNWDRWANSMEPYLRQAERGGTGLTSEQQAHLAQAYKSLNPDARLMPDVVPTRTTTADPAIIQQAREQYPNDPRAREAFINANWNRITPELQATREAQQAGRSMQDQITRMETEAERVGQQRGGSGRATELQRTADKLRMQQFGIQPGAKGARAPEGLSGDKLVQAYNQQQTIYERALRTNPQTAEQFKPSEEFRTRATKLTGGGGGGGGGIQPGTVQRGYRFKGGNPADQNNWEKV